MNEETITAVVSRVIFSRDTFFILYTDEGVFKGNVYDCGEDPTSIVGQKYRFTGKWVTDQRGGSSFAFTHSEMQSDQLFFFLTKIVKNIGENLATLLIGTFNDDLETIIEEDPNKLLSVKGIGEKKLAAILKSWAKYGHLRQLTKFVGQYGLSQNAITKIFNRFGEQSIPILKANPYRLTEISGIGFAQADSVALKMGVSPDSPFRINSCCEHVLSQEADMNGHSYLFINTCVASISELLNADVTEHISSTLITEVISKDDNDFCCFNIGGKDVIGLEKYKEYEDFICSYIRNNKDIELPFLNKEEFAQYFEEYEAMKKIKLSNKQKWAIYHACTRKVFALSGYAGTGKSSISQIFMELLANRYGEEDIVGCALSGIAARRLSNVSGFPAYTIHSLLSYQGGSFQYNKDNRLPYRVVILDESGMVSAYMFYILVSALRDDAILVMIGDDAQLPPIGAGNVFGDIIHKQLTSQSKLDKVFRQNDESVITLFAQSVRQAEMPPEYTKERCDWKYINSTPQNYWKLMKNASEEEKKVIRAEINNTIKKQVAETIHKYLAEIDDILTDFQILVPQRKGELGTFSLNALCQEIYTSPATRPDSMKLQKGGSVFCVGDKIVHTVNKDMPIYGADDFDDDENSKIRTFNGTLGIIEDIDHEEGIVIARMNTGITIVYDFLEMGDIVELAYALTVHKAQGSEFKNVLIPLTASFHIMLNNQWLYTAITRAKQHITIIAEEYAFKRACTNKEKKTRNTWLSVSEHF